MNEKESSYIMIFVSKHNRQIAQILILLTLTAAFCFTGIAEGREISNDFNMPEIEYRVNETETKKETEEKAEEIKDNQNDITGVFHTQNVLFTENDRRFVVVYPNSSWVSLTRNENAANKSKEEVCRFL
ncbi:MAG: hypothetical protein LBE57_04970 [Methanosarcinales archaeon]|jgi:molybdopterin synthase catalytic subunit|nr:hypothetical protein [Methanosarcinales archaeon]